MSTEDTQVSTMAAMDNAAQATRRPRVPLLRRSDRCLPPEMQCHIATYDLDTLHSLVTRIVQLGTPTSCARRGAEQHSVTSADAAGEAMVGSRCYDDTTHKVGALPFGCEPRPPCLSDANNCAITALDDGQTSLEVARVLRRYCDQVCRLLQRETAGVGRNAFAYNMPRELQAELVPVLYAWLVDWSFLCDHVQSWLAVMRCFAAVYRMPLVALPHRPVYTLPWRPLLALLRGLTDPTNLVVKVIRHAYDQVQHELPTLCELAAYHFDADALEEIWDYCAPHFAQDGSGGPIHLVLLYHLLPPLRLCADTSDGSEALPLTRHIVDFLLRDAFDWHTRSAHWQAFRVKLLAKMLASNIGLLDFAPYAEPYFTALLQSLELSLEERPSSSSSAAASSAAVALALGTGTTSGASAVPTRNGLAACMTNSLSPVFNDFAPFQFDRSEILRAQTYIVNALPADTTAPLWNHLRRWLHATQSFIGQGGGNHSSGRGRNGQRSDVAMLYRSLVAIAHLRMRQQGQRGATRVASGTTSEATQEVVAAFSDEDNDEDGGCEDDVVDEMRSAQKPHVRPIPVAYVWTHETLSCFVDLLLPGVTTLLRAGWSDATSTMGLLCALAPHTMLPVVMRYADVGLHSVNEVESQRVHALQLLQQVMYPLVTNAATHDAWLRYLAEVVPGVVAWMNPSAPRVSTAVIWFIFAVSATLPLTHLLRQNNNSEGGAEAVTAAKELLLDFVARVLELYALNKDEPEQTLDAVHAILTRTFTPKDDEEVVTEARDTHDDNDSISGTDGVLVRLVDKVVREASSQEATRAVFALLAIVAECAPRLVLRRVRQRVVPVLRSRASNDEEVRWAAQMLSAALAGAGAAEAFACADVVLDCVKAQLHYVTNRRRVEAAVMLYEALHQALLYPRCVCALPAEVKSGARHTSAGDRVDGDDVNSESRGSATRVGMSCDLLAGSARLRRRLGFCTSTQVRLRWREPTAAHVTFLLRTFDDLVGEVVYVTEHITDVVSSDVAARHVADGLRALCTITTTGEEPPMHNASGQDAKVVEEYHSESAAPVTPHNVLCGVAQWLLEVVRINQCFYLSTNTAARKRGNSKEEEEEVEQVTVNAQCSVTVTGQPWWDGEVRAGWGLVDNSSVTAALDLHPRYTREYLFDFVAQHMLRRMAGDFSSLNEAFGAAATQERLAVVPYLCDQRGRPALDAAHAERGDVRGLQLVLSLLRTLALPTMRPGACPAHRLSAVHESAMLGYRCILAEPLHHVRYMPADYWAYVATTRRHQYTFHRGCVPAARATVNALMNIAHVLLFRTGHPALSMQCAELVVSCVELMPPLLAQLLLVAHSHLLAQLAINEEENDSRVTFSAATSLPRLMQLLLLRPGEADTSPTAHEEDDNDNDDDDEDSDAEENATDEAAANNNMASTVKSAATRAHLRKSVLVGALLFALNGTLLPAIYEDTTLVLALQRLLLFYPESLVYRRVGTAVRQAQRKLSNTSLYLRPAMSAALLEAQIDTAVALGPVAPLRASSGLDIAAALYRPSYKWMISAPALRSLLELSVSPFPALHRAASQLLRSVLLMLREPAALRGCTDVLLRRGRLTSDEATAQADRALFQRRYRVLQRHFGTVPLAKTCEVYLARSIRLPLRLPEDFFAHVAEGEEEASGLVRNDDDAPLQPLMRWRLIEHAYPYLTSNDNDASARRAECVRLVQEHLRVPSATSTNPQSTTVVTVPLERTWAWQLLQLCQEPRRKALEHVPDRRLWAYLGEVTGAATLVHTGVALVRATLDEFSARVDAVDIAARTSALGVFRALFELASALVYITHRPTLHQDMTTSVSEEPMKRDALKQTALQTYITLLRYTCGPNVPNELLRCMALSCRGLAELLTEEEMWTVYDALFDLVGHDGAEEGGSQTVIRAVALIAQLLSVLAFETSETLLEKLLQAVRGTHRAVFFHHATTQGRRHTASALRQLLRLSLHATTLVPERSRILPLLADFVAQVEREDMGRYCCRDDGALDADYPHHRDEAAAERPNNNNNDDDVALPRITSTRKTHAVEEDTAWTPTPALTPAVVQPGVLPASPVPLCESGGVDEFVLTPLTQSARGAGNDAIAQPTPLTLDAPQELHDEAGSQDVVQQQRRGSNVMEVSPTQRPRNETSVVVGPTPYELSELKTMVMCWNDAPLPLLRSPASRPRHLLRFLCCVLDISLSEVDTLHDAAASTLHSFAIARLPKATVHDLVDFCCDVLLSSSSTTSSQPQQTSCGDSGEKEQQVMADCVTCGTSRRAKVGLTAALRWLVFFNLHRIGRFAMLKRVAEAALHVVSHGDGRLRQEGRWLMMVLTKVCSTEQTAALVQGYLRELRTLSETAAMSVSQSSGAESSLDVTRGGHSSSVMQRDAVRRRTALVIGLCAVLEADPGAMPSYVPRLMERLMRYAHDGPQESRRAVVRAFERWWASHRERWEFEFREHFTPAQAEAMMSILKAPSYYA